MVKAEENTLRILQYNVLAESYAPNAWLPHVPPHILSWKARSWAVLRHIAAFDADVVCLQEIDHYADFFQPEMTALGYTGQFTHLVLRQEHPSAAFRSLIRHLLILCSEHSSAAFCLLILRML